MSYICIALILLFVILFATGPGSIPWFLVSELFNQSARPAATSLAVAINWTANFIVGLGFSPLQVSVISCLISRLFIWRNCGLFHFAVLWPVYLDVYK